jgi:hypothetical protein
VTWGLVDWTIGAAILITGGVLPLIYLWKETNLASSWSIVKWAYRRYKREKFDAYWKGYWEGYRRALDDNEEETSDLQQDLAGAERGFLSSKEHYAELARALGFEGDGFWGDPNATHEEIVARAKFLAGQPVI